MGKQVTQSNRSSNEEWLDIMIVRRSTGELEFNADFPALALNVWYPHYKYLQDKGFTVLVRFRSKLVTPQQAAYTLIREQTEKTLAELKIDERMYEILNKKRQNRE